MFKFFWRYSTSSSDTLPASQINMDANKPISISSSSKYHEKKKSSPSQSGKREKLHIFQGEVSEEYLKSEVINERNEKIDEMTKHLDNMDDKNGKLYRKRKHLGLGSSFGIFLDKFGS